MKIFDKDNTDKFSKKELITMALNFAYDSARGKIFSREDFKKRAVEYYKTLTELLDS
jgi:hypothetical protein